MSSQSSLNLIPKSGDEFHDKNYWDKFFQIRGTKAFEWYGEYEHLCDVLHTYLKIDDKILNLGCGNSRLSENMYDVGIKNITNIDIIDVVIKQMAAKNKNRTELKFLKMDMLAMTFADKEFNCVIDKGTLDALMSDEQADTSNENVNKMFNEIDRVLNVNGKYICITLAQDHILQKLLSTFTEK
jgi:ubiquinone/menaquinone biosynthesis C-methylase UbiE